MSIPQESILSLMLFFMYNNDIYVIILYKLHFDVKLFVKDIYYLYI